MVNPSLMCRKHLLGEHVELHMLSGCILKGKSIKGFLDKGLLAPRKIFARHEELIQEITKRGYNHKSPLPKLDVTSYPQVKINKEKSHKELITRCPECRNRIANLEQELKMKKNLFK